jgi:tetratricopeptide (TPR) repeat protein
LFIALSAKRYVAEQRRQRAASQFLQQAADHEERQEWLAAAECLQNYLDLEPAAEDQRVRLARLFAAGTEDDAEQQQRTIELLYRAVGVCREEERVPLQRQLAERLFKSGRCDEALAVSANALASQPDDVTTLQVRALALWRQYRRGELDDWQIRKLPVIAWLDVARRAQPANVELAEATAAAYRDLHLAAPDSLNVSSRETAADDCLDQLVAAAPQDPATYLARYRYRKKHRHAEAEADLAMALRSGPHHAAVLQSAAAAAAENHDFGPAAALYRRAIDAATGSTQPETYLGLGDALLALDQRDQALRAWQEGLRTHPEAECLFLGRLADAYLANQQWDTAAKLVEQIDSTLSEQTSSDAALLTVERDQSLRRGLLVLHAGDQLTARSHFERVITLQEQLGGGSSQATLAWQRLGEIHAQRGEWESAAAAFDYACHEAPHLAGLWLQSAEAHAQAENGEVAMARAHVALRKGLSTPADVTLARTIISRHHWHFGGRPWPHLASVNKAIDDALASPSGTISGAALPLDGALVLAQSSAQRGEYETAEDVLLGVAANGSAAQRAAVDREFALEALSRGDIERAHSLLALFITNSTSNSPLLELAAQIDIENDHRRRTEEKKALFP